MYKTNWTTTGSDIKIQMEFSKVDVGKREVHGFASLDNIDLQGDLVTAESSVDAFQKFRGNIREMHKSDSAVGRMLDFQPEFYIDPETQEVYNGIFVKTYVSRGAQDTWEKVIDGTLTGFSIQGSVQDSEAQLDPKTGRQINVIKAYTLTELSLVDSPANQFANVATIVKTVDGANAIEGDLADVSPKTILFCDKDQLSKISDKSEDCHECGNTMQSIGWVNSADSDYLTVAKSMIKEYLNKSNEGGVENMPEELEENNSEEEVVEVEAEADTVNEEEAVTEEVAEETSEEEVTEAEAAGDEGEDELAKAFRILEKSVSEQIQKGHGKISEEMQESTDALQKRFEEALAKLDEKVEQVAKSQSDFAKQVSALDENLGKVEKGLTNVDSTFAKRKSEDSDQSEDSNSTNKSMWSGSPFSMGL